MIQDIAPHRLWNQYIPGVQPDGSSLVFCFSGSEMLTALIKGKRTFPTVSMLPEEKSEAYTYLFRLDDRNCFLLNETSAFRKLLEAKEAVLPEEITLLPFSKLRSENTLMKEELFAAHTAKHLSDWYRDTKFCGRCGMPNRHSATERAMVCTSCKNRIYPRIMPAVIVGVKNGEKLLLTRYPGPGRYNALIAGFNEIGETLEETVAREVMEEAGIRVKNIRYYKSQPWGWPNDILTGFYCDVDGDDRVSLDDNELAKAVWVSREEIQLQSDDFTLTNEMMTQFKLGNQ